MKQLKINEVQAIQLVLMKKLHQFLAEEKIPYYLIAGSALGAVRHKGFIPWDDDIDIGLFRRDYERFLQVANRFDPTYEIINSRNANNCDFSLTRIYFPDTMIDIPSIKNTVLDKRLYMDIFPLDNVPDDKTELQSYEKKIKSRKNLIARIDVRDYGTSAFALVCKKAVSACLQNSRASILKKTENLMRRYEEQNTKAVCSLCSQYSFKKQVMPREYYGIPTLYQFEDTMFYGPEKMNEYLTTLYGADYMQIPPESKRREGHDIYSTK